MVATVDFHTHILPGIDDGSGSLEESLAMAAMAADQGIRHMVATPHCITGSVREVMSNVTMLQELLREEHIPLQLYPGMEIFGTCILVTHRPGSAEFCNRAYEVRGGQVSEVYHGA